MHKKCNTIKSLVKQQQQQNSSSMQNVELMLSTHLKKIDECLEEFSARFSSHLFPRL